MSTIVPGMTIQLTVEQLVLAAITVLGGGSGVAYLIFRGLWSKSIQPLVQAEITTYLQKPDVLGAQKNATRAEIVLIHNEPAEMDKRKSEIRAVIDDHIRRDDGLIHKELNARVKEQQNHFDKKMDELLAAVRERNEGQDQMIGRLAKVEGMLTVLLKGSSSPSSTSQDHLPAQKPGRGSSG